MAENRVEEFKKHMKEEFAKIPTNLSIEECFDRADRCLSLSESFHQQGEKYKAKKYELLSFKYKQLAENKKHPKPVIVEKQSNEAQAIVEEAKEPEKKEGWFKRLVKFYFG